MPLSQARLKTEEQTALQQTVDEDADLAAGYRLLQPFRKIMMDRDGAALDAWLHDAQASRLASFAGLANGIIKDRAAVDAALTMRWSTSIVEGHTIRVKLTKRQGYDRSSFALLRRRILAASCVIKPVVV